MKIVQYMLGFRNADGGVVRAVIDLCAALAQRGHQVIVLTMDASDAPPDWDGRDGRPALSKLPLGRWLPHCVGSDGMRQARQAFAGADVIHLHVPWDPICAQLGRLARRMNVPYFLSVHGMLDDWTMARKAVKKRIYLALAGRRLLEQAVAVQCSAQVEMEQSSKWYPRGRSVVVPLLFDLEPYRQLPGPQIALGKFADLAVGDPVALHVGRLHPIKRIEMLLDAAARLSARNMPCTVIIAGSGDAAYEKQLRERAAAMGLAQRVIFAGFVAGEEKMSLYQAADVVVHPSAHESFGFVTTEALACGTPIVTTKAVNIWPELESSGGALIAEQSAEAIAQAMEALLMDKPRRQQMGRRGRQWVFDHLEPTRVVQLYETMYREAISSKPKELRPARDAAAPPPAR